MKHRAFPLVLAASLLAYVVASFSGCGKPNPLAAIIISPLTPVVAKGNAYQLLVTAVFANRLTVPAWSQVTWASSSPAVATVSSTGLVSAIETGTTEITATDIFHPTIAHSVTLYVTELVSLDVTPTIATIVTGTTQQFRATGLYTNTTPSAWSASPIWPFVDLTDFVIWTSSSTAIATVGNILGSHGLATAVSAGTTTITATVPATSPTGTTVTGTAILEVI